MPSDKQLLAELEELLATEDDFEIAAEDDLHEPAQKFRETYLELILPIGIGKGYALNSEGDVVGIKLSLLDTDLPSQDILDKVLRFRSLRRLVLTGLRAIKIPPRIKELKHLNFLWLGGTIKNLPPEILDFNLDIYLPRSKKFIELLAVVSRPAVMRFINIEEGIELNDGDKNELESIKPGEPEQFSQLLTKTASLKGIFIDSETLEEPPIEIVSRGRDAIKSYFQGLGTESLPLNELKVLLVGNGAAGKTSLMRRVFGESFNTEEPQTHGINIRSRFIPTVEGESVKLNFWDFGGQEIMHATHQFFLSKRSMYILVLDGRKDEDPEYWLQHIESFGGDSPIMVVLNKIDEHPSFDVNRRFLKSKYSGIVDFFRISCATGAGIPDFTEQLVEQLTSAPITKTLWPGSWFRVKQRLEHWGSAFVSLSEYRKICEEEHVKGAKSQELLVDFLNDLGVVLHFKDMELLDTHVLDPRWVTEAVYRIINSELLAAQKGILHLNQLGTVLEPPAAGGFIYEADKHRYIVELMLKFELCYRLDSKSILVPDLLDIQEPPLTFEYRDILRFVFEYSYLPKSIMPRFIVRMHKDIKGGARWRTGVLLEDKSFEATAWVLADAKDKRIYVSVGGKQRRDYFSVIRKAINDLNSSFEKIGVTELVPLPNVPDIMLDYKELLGYEQAHRDEIFIGRLGLDYNVEALLNGIEKISERVSPRNQVLNIHGDYFENAYVDSVNRFVGKQRQIIVMERHKSYKPQSWEKIVVYLTGFLFLAVVSFLAIRNQPVADPNLVVLLRIILSMVVAVFGATIPGMLQVDLSVKGLTIRAIGALALFVIAYLLTPQVL